MRATFRLQGVNMATRNGETIVAAMAANLARAFTDADLCALWSDWIGDAYTGDDLRADLQDFIRETCYGCGVHCPTFD